MMATLLGDVLLRQVPAHLLAGVQAGDLQVYGSVIRSLTSGRIVGHLQETSGLAKLGATALASHASLPLTGAGLAVDLVGHGVSYVQNEQIKAAVSVVQNLQIANLALGAIGIGVSVAGFAILSAKISRVEANMDAMAGRLDEIARGVESLRRDRIADDFTRLRTAAEQMDEGWSLSDPAPQWRQVATEAHSLANIFERRARELTTDPADVAAAEPFLDALGLAAGLRVSARLASGDDAAGRAAASEGTKALVSVGEHISLGASALREMRPHAALGGSRDWDQALAGRVDTLRPLVERARQREAAAASTSLTLAELQRQDINGRAWLEAARSEEAEPVLCLLPSAS
jgi:hypothetical protein